MEVGLWRGGDWSGQRGLRIFSSTRSPLGVVNREGRDPVHLSKISAGKRWSLGEDREHPRSCCAAWPCPALGKAPPGSPESGTYG